MRGSVHVVPRGELDIASVPHLDRSLRMASDAEQEVVLDLRELDFIDCSGVHLLMSADRRIRRSGGRLRVIGGSGEVARLMQLVGLDTELEMIEPPGPDDALFARAVAAAGTHVSAALVSSTPENRTP